MLLFLFCGCHYPKVSEHRYQQTFQKLDWSIPPWEKSQEKHSLVELPSVGLHQFTSHRIAHLRQISNAAEFIVFFSPTKDKKEDNSNEEYCGKLFQAVIHKVNYGNTDMTINFNEQLNQHY